jgi:hypothetical protein
MEHRAAQDRPDPMFHRNGPFIWRQHPDAPLLRVLGMI